MDDALTPEVLAQRLRTRVIGRHAEYHETIDSTNARALALAAAGAPEGTLVLADLQTQGRGRLDRRWHAPTGSSLLMTLLFRPALQAREVQRLTMICSLAIVQAVAEVTALRPAVKWPNDIYLNARKLGGLLTELRLRGTEVLYVVVGMGLNVNVEIATLPAVRVPAISLSDALGRPVSRLQLLTAILEGVEARYDRLRDGWSPHVEWREHLLTLGQTVRVSEPDASWEGLAEDVDQDGALCVRDSAGILHTVRVGDVTLRHPWSETATD